MWTWNIEARLQPGAVVVKKGNNFVMLRPVKRLLGDTYNKALLAAVQIAGKANNE